MMPFKESKNKKWRKVRVLLPLALMLLLGLVVSVLRFSNKNSKTQTPSYELIDFSTMDNSDLDESVEETFMVGSYDLENRELLSDGLPHPEVMPFQEGTIVFDIAVLPSGEVGACYVVYTFIKDDEAILSAQEAVYKARFNESTHPIYKEADQMGNVTYEFFVSPPDSLSSVNDSIPPLE